MFTFSLLFTGFLTDTPFLSGVALKSECAVACVNDANCSSFFYDVNTQACYLEKYVFVSSDKLQTRSDVQYFSLLNGACPASYIYSRFTNQCLRRFWSPIMTYPAAKTLCMDNSGHLAFIRSQEENRQAAIVARNETLWIGLERDPGDEWHWTNGQSLGSYVNWNSTRIGDDRIYGKMFGFGRWGTYGSTGALRALCEIDV
ncbi:uncharacterized protein [Haliotis asinina]|uniref:uncharacterized protein n=1 Tax=Haliotis asinina TaxID=109174 RepID=UPI003531AA0F